MAYVLELFHSLDTKQRGYLSLDDLRQVSPDVSEDELRYIFDQMDADGDGRVSQTEFVNSYERVLMAGERSGYRDLKRRGSLHLGAAGGSGSNTPKLTRSPHLPVLSTSHESETYYSDADQLENIPCQDEVLALYEQLQAAGTPAVLTTFEKVIGGFVKEIKEHREQNERLQRVYEREKDLHSRNLSEAELDIDRHLQIAEERARKAEREKLEREKEEMRQSLESEIHELQSNIKQLQKMENLIAEKEHKMSKLTEIKEKIEEMGQENRHLRNNLCENQLEMTMIKSELCTMRQEYDEKCIEMINEKEMLLNYVHEKETAVKQLELMIDANKRLHDTNDNLRSALETRSSICRQLNITRSPSPLQQAGSMSSKRSTSSVLTSQQHLALTPTREQWHRDRLTRPDRLCVDTDDTDIDSGFARGASDNDGGNISSEQSTDLEHYMTHNSSSRRGSDLESSVSTHTTSTTAASHRRRKQKCPSATGPPERTFRVVLAGDASVGKSSLIMRLTKGEFVEGLPSTLGVDFHVKVLNVDGKNVAIQLWDTAGQERFRSLSKSYFRRADGALLMYDVTCESSFLNVRSWMDTIQESSTKPIPVLLCANKIDLRIPATAEGKKCVSTADGAKLAKVYDAIHYETSAKHGDNTELLAIQLVRELLAQEDCEMKGASLVLDKNEKTSETSGRCVGGQKKCT